MTIELGLLAAMNRLAGTTDQGMLAAANTAVSRMAAVEANGGNILLSAGQTSYPRDSAIFGTAAFNSGDLIGTYFTAGRTETVSAIAFITDSQAAASTPSLIRYGLWTEASDGALTLVASTPNDLTLLAVAQTRYSKNLSTPYQLALGQRYCVAPLVVSATTMPIFKGVLLGAASIVNAEYDRAPRQSFRVTGQTDLPASLTNAAIAAAPYRANLYATMI